MTKKDVYMRFDYYMEHIQKLLQIVQDLENLCVQMSQMTDIKKLNTMFKKDCRHLFSSAQHAIRKIEYYKQYIRYEDCELNKEVAKITARCKEYENLCVKTHADTLQRLVFGPQVSYITSDNERLKLVVEKLEAEAKIKEADAVIAAAEKAKADLAIEEHKTEQLRLQAEERKAREEEAILSVEERCRIMYNEFLETLQGGIVNPAKIK